MTERIFISYRRDDSQAAAGRLYDRLLQHFERGQVFLDVDAIEPGIDFVKTIDDQISNCGAFIAVIGPDWLVAQKADGSRRLDDPHDYVRIEIEAALNRDVRVIPVLVDGAAMPQSSDLPPSLQALARRNAMEVAHHRFLADCDDLARWIRRALGVAQDTPVSSFLSSLPPEQAVERMSWAEVLFSFRGRISRQQFLIGLISVLAFAIAVFGAILITLNVIIDGMDDGQAREGIQRLMPLIENRLSTVAGVCIWWPTWALILKRLHDLGHGWKTLLVFIAMDFAMVALELTDNEEWSLRLLLFALGITFMLAAVKGEPGPNQYGPDPLLAPRSP